MAGLGVVLGSGGARGGAHIGVMKALDEAGVPVSVVTGTSVGSLVGASYAAGKLDALEELTNQFDLRELLYYFVDVKFPRSGLIDGSKVVKLIHKLTGKQKIEDLDMVYRAVATDILTGEEIVIDHGDLMDAVRASISVPGVFTPARWEGRFLVDGGLLNPLPIDAARAAGADVVLAIDINHQLLSKNRGSPPPPPPPKKSRTGKRLKLLKKIEAQTGPLDWKQLKPVKKWRERSELPNIFDVIGNMVHIFEYQVGAVRLKHEPADLLIQPDLPDLNFMDFHRMSETSEAGYKAMKKALPKLHKLLEAR